MFPELRNVLKLNVSREFPASFPIRKHPIFSSDVATLEAWKSQNEIQLRVQHFEADILSGSTIILVMSCIRHGYPILVASNKELAEEEQKRFH